MKKNGQSIVEYALIAILVILGIVFMGAYVLRSVNAHFKLWDEGVHESFEEHIKQAPVNDVPYINSTCNCSAQVGSCGSSQAGSFCPANEREVDYICTIQGCNGANGNSTCATDVPGYPPCCSSPVAIGCGTFPLPSGGSIVGTTPPAANNCYYGYQIYQQECGSNSPITCTQDPTCPLPQCQGFILFQNSTSYCAGSQTQAQVGLTQNTQNTYVGNDQTDCITGTGAPSCQVYCNAPYTVNATKTACALQLTVAPVCNQNNYNTMKSTCSCISDCGSDTPTYRNDKSFEVCVDTSTRITSVSEIPYGPTVPPSPGIGSDNNGGCGNPGEPSQTCAVQVSN